MIGPGVARELARQRERAIVRELERPRLPSQVAELLPSASIAVGVLAIVALGAPVVKAGRARCAGGLKLDRRDAHEQGGDPGEPAP